MEPIDRIELTCAPIRHSLGWRRARDTSLALAELLSDILPKEIANQVAEAITGEKPIPFLTADETVAELRRRNISMSRDGLYRLARRAPGGRATYVFDKDGNWDHEGSAEVLSPVFAVTVIRVEGGFTRFLINDLSQQNS